VNRCLTEGRQALSGRLAGIEGGVECARLAPLLSALADGEADAAALARLRPHLKTCLACRARLREYRAAPARVAALVPAAALAGDDGGGTLRSLLESVVGAVQQKVAAVAERAHAAAELAAGQKAAAVAASAAALAGGGTAVDHFANHQGPPRPEAQQAPAAAPIGQDALTPDPHPPPQSAEQLIAEKAPPVAAAPVPPAQPEPHSSLPDPANEFTPSTGSASEPLAMSSAAASTASAGQSTPAPAAPARPPPATGAGGDGPGEFAP